MGVYKRQGLGCDKVKKRFIAISLACLLLASTVGGIAIASDTFDALYTGVIRVSNNSTANTSVSVPFTASSADYITGGFMNSSANNTAIQQSTGVDVTYMPGYGDSNPWVIFVPSIGANAILNDTLYMGGPTAMDSRIRYFPANAGMSVTDNETLELGDNFTVEITGWIDTDNGTDKNLVYKEDAFGLYVSPTVSGTITANITATGVSYTVNDDVWDDVNGDFWRVQTFTPTSNFTAKRVSIKTYRVGNPDILTINIFNTVAGKPSGGSLSSGSINATTYFTDNVAGAWYIIDMSDYAVENGTLYALQLTALSGDGANKVQWAMDETAPAYADGTRVWSNNAGAAWTVDAAADFMFSFVPQPEVTVTEISTGEHTITAPSNPALFGLGVDLANDTALPLDSGLVMNLPLHHTDLTGTTLTTKDNNRMPANVTGAVWGNTGRTFDGTNDVITIPHHALFNVSTGDFTITLWFRSLTEQGIIGKPESGINWWDLGFVANKLVWTFWDSNVNFPITSTNTINDDVWRQVSIIRSSGIITMRFGTTSEGTVDATGRDLNMSGDLLIGQAGIGASFGDAEIGEVRFYNRALSTAERVNNYNATKWRYDGSVSGNTTTHFPYIADDATVPDNANNWVFLSGIDNASLPMPYMESTNITIDGVLAGDWAWGYGATFTDQSVNNNTATPSFRSTRTDPDVSATLLTFEPISEARAPAFSINITTTGWITGSITQTGNFTAATTNTTYPGSDITVAVTTAGGVPIQLFEIIMAGVIVLALSLFISYLMRRNRAGSIFVKILVISAGLGIMIAVSIIDDWMLYLFLMISIALGMMASRRDFTGTGNAGNNMIGFLTMSFVGMTMINRILEGRVLLASDVNTIRSVLAFQPFNVFGLFTIPVPNTSFLTEGLPALMMWDYSFFGGNAQIFQYLLYSITAVVSFILLVLVFGALYQMFSRPR